MIFNTAYSERLRVHPPLGELSMTKQSFAEESEINNILAKYAKTGLITHVKEGGQYADLPAELDYHTSINIVMAAQASFASLPAEIRKEFENDPRKFLTFVENPDNVKRMGELGLLNDPPDKPAVEAEQPPLLAAEAAASAGE